jgi:large subunit ribosomal protein L12
MEYIYAGMLIHKVGGTLNEDTVKKVIQAAGGKPDDGQARALVAALKDVNIEEAIKEAAASQVVAAAPAAGGAAPAAKKEEKKEDEKKSAEAAAAGLSSLFG